MTQFEKVPGRPIVLAQFSLPTQKLRWLRHLFGAGDMGFVRPHAPRQRPLAERPLCAPEILEPRRGQLSIPDGVLDIPVTKIGLQSPRVVPLIGQRVAAGVPEHVRVRLEPKPRPGPYPLDHTGEPSGCERCPTLRSEHEG